MSVETYFPAYRIVRIKERGMKLNGEHLGVITAIGIPIYWPRGIVPFTGHILLITPAFRADNPDNPFGEYKVSFWEHQQKGISLSIYERPGWILSDIDENYIHYDNFHNLEDFIVFLEEKLDIQILQRDTDAAVTEIDSIIF